MEPSSSPPMSPGTALHAPQSVPPPTDGSSTTPSSPRDSSANRANMPLRPSNRTPKAQPGAGVANTKAEVDQHLMDTIELVPNSKLPLGISCKTTIDPTRGMVIQARSLQLIRKIKESGQTTVQVGCGTLEKVLSCIGLLQKQNYWLHSKLGDNSINQRLTVARHPPPSAVPATTFTLFPKLPLEIRRMIWNLVLYTPRTISADMIVPRPQLRPKYTQGRTRISAVCQESRAEAKKAQVALNKVRIGERTFFINPTVDILWLSAWGISDEEWILVLKVLRNALAYHILPKIAVNLELWDRLMSAESTRTRFLDALAGFSTNEIVIVMGSLAAFGSQDLVLREPRGRPRLVLHTNFLSRFRQLPLYVTWEQLNGTLLLEVTNTILIRAQVRHSMIGAGLNPDSATFGGRFKDLSYWDFRKVHFMEATTMTSLKRSREQIVTRR